MSRMFDDSPYGYGIHARHKMTTDRQYSLLKHSMTEYLQKNPPKTHNTDGTSSYKQDYLHWTELTKKLNKLGPPHRTIQQWKKVWCDYKRADKRRKAKLKNKMQNKSNDGSQRETRGEETINDSEIKIKTENKDNDQNSQSIYSTYSNDFDNDYSYPDDDSLLDLCKDESVSYIPDESSCGSYNYASCNYSEHTTAGNFDHSAYNDQFSAPPPPLQASSTAMHTQTLYTLQNQMEHQTKLLEHLSQMSSTMTSLMERQVQAVEKQTEAMRRQASATERHTAVMNRLFDIIQEKFLKTNSHKTTDSADDIS